MHCKSRLKNHNHHLDHALVYHIKLAGRPASVWKLVDVMQCKFQPFDQGSNGGSEQNCEPKELVARIELRVDQKVSGFKAVLVGIFLQLKLGGLAAIDGLQLFIWACS